MTPSDQEYIASLQQHAADARALFSNVQKPERERMVVRAFLRCVGIPFTDDEIQATTDEPIDVRFRTARFQVRDVVGSRKRGDDWREREHRYKSARQVSELLEPWTPSKPLSFAEVSQLIVESLVKKASRYGIGACAKLDALVYVDLKGRHLWPLETGIESKVAMDMMNAQGWRSCSIVFLPYGSVLTAKKDAPDFLSSKVGIVLSKWSRPDGWFDA